MDLLTLVALKSVLSPMQCALLDRGTVIFAQYMHIILFNEPRLPGQGSPQYSLYCSRPTVLTDGCSLGLIALDCVCLVSILAIPQKYLQDHFSNDKGCCRVTDIRFILWYIGTSVQGWILN